MTVKQAKGTYAPNGAKYGTLTDGAGTLVTTVSSSLGSSQQAHGSQAPDGSIYFVLTDGAGNLV